MNRKHAQVAIGNRPRVKATQPDSLCWSCVHGLDMEYDCTQHERKFIEGVRCIMLECNGHIKRQAGANAAAA